MFAVTYVSKFSHNPGRRHWYALEQILRYLKGTIDYGIVYENTSNIDLQGHYTNHKNQQKQDRASQILEGMVDASHADDPDNCKSTTG